MLFNIFQWLVFAFGFRFIWILIRDWNKKTMKRPQPGEREFR